jgi:hypothetical protein
MFCDLVGSTDLAAQLDAEDWASSAPSSGNSISRAKAVMLDTPGMLVRMAKRSERLASASTIWRIAASTVAIFEALSILTLQ